MKLIVELKVTTIDENDSGITTWEYKKECLTNFDIDYAVDDIEIALCDRKTTHYPYVDSPLGETPKEVIDENGDPLPF